MCFLSFLSIYLQTQHLKLQKDLKKQYMDDMKRKEENAFNSIYNRYADELLSYGMGMGFNREVLKDAVQDVFYRLYLNKDSIQRILNIKYYLFRSLKNRLLDIHKATMPTNDIQEHEFDFVIQPTIVDELINEEDQIIIQNKIKALLSLLTSRQREAIYLRFIQEMEYEEIGELLDMTPQATRKLVFRGMERMRKQDLPLFILLLVMLQGSPW